MLQPTLITGVVMSYEVTGTLSRWIAKRCSWEKSRARSQGPLATCSSTSQDVRNLLGVSLLGDTWFYTHCQSRNTDPMAKNTMFYAWRKCVCNLYFLHQAHYSLLAHRNTEHYFSTTFGGLFKQQDHQRVQKMRKAWHWILQKGHLLTAAATGRQSVPLFTLHWACAHWVTQFFGCSAHVYEKQWKPHDLGFTSTF